MFIRIHRVFLYALMALLALGAAVTPAAGQANAPEFLLISHTRVKPEMLQDWQDLIKTEGNLALQKAGVPWRNVWASAVFGDAYRYVSATPITNFAQFDQPSPIVRGLGQEAATRYGHKLRRCIDGSQSELVRYREDLSLPGDMASPPKLAVLTIVRTVPGKSREFENWIKTDILTAYKKIGVQGYLVHQTIFGGDANAYVTVTLRNSFADLDKGPLLTQAVGAEAAAAILQRAAPFVASVERFMTRYVPELSYSAATTAAK